MALIKELLWSESNCEYSRLPDEEIQDYQTLNKNSTSSIKSILIDEDDVFEEDLYHCHTKSYKNRPNLAARRTLIIASIICLLFMLAEIVEMNGALYQRYTEEYHCHFENERRTSWDSARIQSWRRLVCVATICACFIIVQTVGGLLAGSLAIITDAAHLLTDFASFLISLFSLFVASKPASRRMSFGWHRAEVLGAFVSVLLIWVVTGVLVYIAIQRIISKNYDIDARIMLITAAIGVSVNIIMGLLLHFCGEGHGHTHMGHSPHSHSHSNGLRPESVSSDTELSPRGSSGRNINVRAAFIHVLGDLVQSVGVFIAALVIFYRPDLSIIDPICTFIFSILVLITTLAVMRDALNVLMEGIPRGMEFGEVVESLEAMEGVTKVHDLRIWALTMDKVALSVHLAIESQANAQEVLKSTNLMLRKAYGVYESTVQIERYSDSMKDCTKCEQPK